MSKPLLLDLFCGAGGAAMGYARAGFRVVGVDKEPQPHYPFVFVRGDALEFLDCNGRKFDAIHASPPCQHASSMRALHPDRDYPSLIPATREGVRAAGIPYVIENVIGAQLEAPMLLCGTMFGLDAIDNDGKVIFLRRHRLFESNLFLAPPTVCVCRDRKNRGFRVAGVYGGGSTGTAQRHARRFGYTPNMAGRRALMEIDWMNGSELSQAIPPAYTEYIGVQLLRALEVAA